MDDWFRVICLLMNHDIGQGQNTVTTTVGSCDIRAPVPVITRQPPGMEIQWVNYKENKTCILEYNKIGAIKILLESLKRNPYALSIH